MGSHPSHALFPDSSEKQFAHPSSAIRTCLRTVLTSSTSSKLHPNHILLLSLAVPPHLATHLILSGQSADGCACHDRQGNVEEERLLLEQGLALFPAFDKLWLMLGQLEERLSRVPAARTAYQTGLRRCIHRCV